MDPELANRLRRYGEQVDHAAIAAQARRPAASAGVEDSGGLPTVVSINAAPSRRRVQMITAAAAAAIVVLAGAAIMWRITGDNDLAPADTAQTTVNTAEVSTSTTVSPTTTSPLLAAAPSTSTTSTTTTAGGASPGGTRPESTVPGSSRTCPNGYHAYDASYPIRVCDEGPAVALIQQRVGAPQSDGFFGPATRQSVIAFQQLNGLDDDGLVGPLTWAAMFPDGAPGTDHDGDGIVEPWEVG